MINDVCYSAKIGILKQITTAMMKYTARFRCLLLCKDRNFKANHNKTTMYILVKKDVCYSAKIGILKQITTDIHHATSRTLMFVTLQR